jgi:hypothetical protein
MPILEINQEYKEYLGAKLEKVLSILFVKYTEEKITMKEALMEIYNLFEQDYIKYFEHPEYFTKNITRSILNVRHRTDYTTNTVAVNLMKLLKTAYEINPEYYSKFIKSLINDFRQLEQKFKKPIEISEITISSLENDLFLNRIYNNNIFVNYGTPKEFLNTFKRLI